ncbi:hypothetical protein DL98DRAFT_19703 [Cadophora sp. DSE1049]|nr:hypothetical protein DL98DRAFT_19703 [Cadophora sp. DSE1049]
MDTENETYFDWIESSVLEEIEVDFAKTFCPDLAQSDLQLNTFPRCPGKPGLLETGVSRNSIADLDELREAATLSDQYQIFCIRQKHSYSRLYITRALFDQLIHCYSVFQRFWDFIIPFSFKTRESDISHAPFRFRQLEPVLVGDLQPGSFECAYGFRYAVLNHRKEAMEGNPDYDPWSIRQTAIYQQYNREKSRVMLILVSPPETSRKLLECTIQSYRDRRRRPNTFDLHRILISNLHENWRLYIRDLEKSLREQSDRVTLTQVQNQTENLSPLANFPINFIDRQRLKMIEDKILDLKIVFESLYNTVTKLQRQCQIHCQGSGCSQCVCDNIVEEFEEQRHEIQVNMKKADILYQRGQGTAQLLSDLLDYENAQIANHNEKSLNDLAKESKEENSKMRILTERSTQDAAAVKILTVITLIYLPVTVVASIFSSQLIQVDESGRLSVISESWWFVVVALPLTVFTFFLWRYWLSYSLREQDSNDHTVHKEETQPRGLRRFRLPFQSGSQTLPTMSRPMDCLRGRGDGFTHGDLA